MVVEAANPSAGQVVAVPSQVSATSQAPAAGRQTVPLADGMAAGHAALLPSHAGVPEHAPLLPQAVPCTAFLSTGQAADVPLHTSATSQGPAAARHTVPAATGLCVQFPGVPESVVQGFPSSQEPAPAEPTNTLMGMLAP